MVICPAVLDPLPGGALAECDRVAVSRADCSPTRRRHGVQVRAVTGRPAFTFMPVSPEQALVLIPRVMQPTTEVVGPDCSEAPPRTGPR